VRKDRRNLDHLPGAAELPPGRGRVSDPVAATTLGDRIALDLKERIFASDLAPGDRLDEQHLAEHYAASRTPVREALRQLAAAGMVERRGRQGAVVAGLTVKGLIDMWEVLADLEGLSARLAARRIAPAQAAALQDIHARLEATVLASDLKAFEATNAEFHELIYVASQNQHLMDSVRQLRRRVAIYERHITLQPGRFRDTVPEHAAVLGAILAHDGASADEAMRAHLGLLGESFTDFLAQLPAVMLGQKVPA